MAKKRFRLSAVSLLLAGLFAGFCAGTFSSGTAEIEAVEPKQNPPIKTRHLTIVDEDGRAVMTLSGSAGNPLVEFLRPQSKDHTRMHIESGGSYSRDETWITFYKNLKPQSALTASGMLFFDADGKLIKPKE